jgi:hypothetical protein
MIETPLLPENTEIATIRETDLRIEQMPVYSNDIGVDFAEYSVANYWFTVIRRNGNYVFYEGKIVSYEAFVDQTVRPVDVCITVPIHGDGGTGLSRATYELSKLVGIKYTQLYEVAKIDYQ